MGTLTEIAKRVLRTAAVETRRGFLLVAPLVCMGVANTSARSATDSDAKAPALKAAFRKKEKPAARTSDEAAPANAPPSRFVSEAEHDAYVSSLSSVLSMRNRTTDPFGQVQDPNAKRIVKTTIARKAVHAQPAQATPFAEIIRKIKVNTVMPGGKCFLIATRRFTQGGTIPLQFRGKTINAEILAVTARRIDLRNPESGETGSISMDVLPVGMKPGTRGISAPGMTPDGSNAPINLDIDTGTPTDHTSQYR